MAYYKKENRYRMSVEFPDGTVKKYYPKSVEQKDKNLRTCKEKGYKILECVKLYPFNTYANQHNFELIYNICFNTIADMEDGEMPWDDELLDVLEKRRERAGEFRSLPLPVAWLPYSEWAEAKEMATAAILHRQDTCIANGRPDLVTYC